MTSPSVILHIGMPKTGTTSIQEYLFRNRAFFSKRGIVFPTGALLPANHVELHISAMRGDRQSPYKHLIKMQEPSPALVAATRDWITLNISSGGNKIIFSAEGLSLLRHPDEIDRLIEMFDGMPCKIVVFLRDRASFLLSYRAQLQRLGIDFSTDPTSFAYVQQDSWIADSDSLIEAYARRFPVRALGYEKAKQHWGSVIPAFLQAIDLEMEDVPDWSGIFENRAS